MKVDWTSLAILRKPTTKKHLAKDLCFNQLLSVENGWVRFWLVFSMV